MVLLDPPLLRGVLGLPGDPPDTLLANLTALRSEFVPAGIEAHIVGFLGQMADRTGQVPPLTLVLQHFQDLQAQGDPVGQTGVTHLTPFVQQPTPLPSISAYRYALDQFRTRLLGDGLALLTQQTSVILTTGLPQRPPKGPPVTLRGPSDAVTFLEQGIAQLTGLFKGHGTEGSLRDAHAVFARYQQRLGQPTSGVFSGVRAIDEIHDGLQPGDLALVLGFTSHLKSTFVLNWAYRAAVHYGKTVAFIPLESSLKALQDMVVVMHCHHPKFQSGGGLTSITYDRFRRGQLTSAEVDIVKAAIDDLASCRDYGQFLYKDPDTANLTVAEIRRWAEGQDKKTPLDLLVVDYLGFVNPSSGGVSMKESAYANMAVREFKQMLMQFRQGKGLAGLSPWQSNREGFKEAEKNGGVYTLRAMAWAPEAEKSSDFVYSVYRDAVMAADRVLRIGNLKARDRRLITTPIEVFADADIKVIEDYDLTRSYQNPIPSLNQI